MKSGSNHTATQNKVPTLLVVICVLLMPALAYADPPDVQRIWDDHCTTCHAGPRAAAGLDLTKAPKTLVNVPSSQAPDEVLVAPGAPAASYLFEKLTDRHRRTGKGGQMPLGGSPIGDDALATVRAWIASLR